MDLELKRKSAPVTGANQGIGPAKAKGLAALPKSFACGSLLRKSRSAVMAGPKRSHASPLSSRHGDSLYHETAIAVDG